MPKVWPLYEPLIQKALDQGSNYTMEEIFAGLCSANMQLWVYGLDAAMVTAIQNDDKTRWCLLLALGGANMEAWKGYLPVVSDWARDKGCEELRIYGRPGWQRALEFDLVYAKLVKKL